jgi:hypothetical protein
MVVQYSLLTIHKNLIFLEDGYSKLVLIVKKGCSGTNNNLIAILYLLIGI